MARKTKSLGRLAGYPGVDDEFRIVETTYRIGNAIFRVEFRREGEGEYAWRDALWGESYSVRQARAKIEGFTGSKIVGKRVVWP